MTRQTAILAQVLTRTADIAAAKDCTACYFADLYGSEYAGERYTDEQLVHRILNEISAARR